MSDLLPEMTDSVIAEKMLKLFDGGGHWGRGAYHRFAERGEPERWCLVGAYAQVTGEHASLLASSDDEDYIPAGFLHRLAENVRSRFPEKEGSWYEKGYDAHDVCTSVNDHQESYENIRILLEEMRSSGEAEHWKGTA